MEQRTLKECERFSEIIAFMEYTEGSVEREALLISKDTFTSIMQGALEELRICSSAIEYIWRRLVETHLRIESTAQKTEILRSSVLFQEREPEMIWLKYKQCWIQALLRVKWLRHTLLNGVSIGDLSKRIDDLDGPEFEHGSRMLYGSTDLQALVRPTALLEKVLDFLKVKPGSPSIIRELGLTDMMPTRSLFSMTLGEKPLWRFSFDS